MKFVYNIYILITILTSTWVVQNAADFTLDELTHLSRALSPMECMRLLEAIYLAMPKEKEPRVITIRETPMNKWISKQACLNELTTWNERFPDKTVPKARVIMIMHLNALGRADLVNYVRKNEDHDKKKKKNPKEKIVKRDTSQKRPDHHPHSRSITQGVRRSRISRRSDQYNDIHRSMIAAISERDVNNRRQLSGPGKIHQKKLEHAAVSRNLLYLIIALGIVVVFICGIVFLIFRRSLRSSPCLGERSDLCSRDDLTQEKGLQCIRFLNDLQCDYETQSNLASQISEIDVEGGSCFNSLGVDSRKSFSDTVLCTERIMPGVSIEELELFDEEPEAEFLGENLAQSSCRCRPLEKKNSCPKSKKKKKKTKVKSKEETKSTKSYLKAMQEKILPRQRRQSKKDSNFDINQFREKILAVLNQECGVCRCCNCTPHWEVDSRKVNRCIRHEKKERKKKPSKRDKCEKLSLTKACDKEVLTYQASVTSGSPMSGDQSARKQESDSAKTSKIQNKEKSGKSVSPRVKRTRDDEALLSSSELSESDQSHSANNDNENRSTFNSKRSKQKGAASVNTSLSAHDKPKRFF